MVIIGDDMYTLGINVSEWQLSMDFQKAYDEGVKFVYICASIGCDEDPKFEEFYDAAVETPLLVGAYHSVDPKWMGEEQMDFHHNVVGSRYFHLPGMIGCERDGKPKEEVMDCVETCASRIPYHPGSESIGVIYSAAWWWNPWMVIDGQSPFWLEYYDLWVANFTDADEPIMPIGWDEWLLWQYSADGNELGSKYGAGSKDICLNRFNGSYEDLLIFCGISSYTERLQALEHKVESLEEEIEKLKNGCIKYSEPVTVKVDTMLPLKLRFE